MGYTKRIAALLFADVAGYSKLTEPELNVYMTSVMPSIAKVVRDTNPFLVNTWGDGLLAAFDDVIDAARAALALRDLFTDTNWQERHFARALAIRIGLHAGTIYVGVDLITRKQN